MIFSWKKRKPIVALAPMDSWTNSVFRRVIKKIAPETVVFTEFISVNGLIHPKRTNQLFNKATYHTQEEKPIIVQLFGNEPKMFNKAAKILSSYNISGIDINFGCPAKKVVGSGGGSNLIKSPKLAADIVKATINGTTLPISVKTRLGWENKNEIFKFAENIFKAGTKVLTVHGRSYKQKFTGESDLKNILKLKKLFPEKFIIGNGDIKDSKTALDLLKTLDGIMIGREAPKNPWLFKEIFCKLKGQTFIPPTLKDKKKLLLYHIKIAEKFAGKYGVLETRKHCSSILRNFPNASELRNKLIKIESYKEAKNILK